MTKITANHLGRAAFVYIRQSTADQLLHNPESRRRQYGLADRARQLGATRSRSSTMISAAGRGIDRPGFERLLAAICEGRVGAVFAIEASRLARNGRDWHTLIEFCGLVGTIIVDEDGIYDPRHQHFGAVFDARHVPGAWSSTANANAALQFVLKDALFLIDDFVPKGSSSDVERQHRDADRIFRGQGNTSGRGRLGRDGTSLRDASPPRGI